MRTYKKGEIMAIPKKPVRVTAPNGTVILFESVMSCMRHYGIDSKQFMRFVTMDRPILKGPRAGLVFDYADEITNGDE